MLNEEKIRIMTDMARYEQGKGKEELRIQKYFRRDYIGKALLRNFFWTTLGYLLLVAVYFIYHMEYYMDNITKMPITPLLMRILLGYVLMLAIYSGLVYLLESLRYVRAKQGAEHYTEYINRLLKLYKREEKLGPGRKFI